MKINFLNNYNQYIKMKLHVLHYNILFGMDDGKINLRRRGKVAGF